VLGDFDTARYRTERLWATADDGTAIPLSLVYRRDRADLLDEGGPGSGAGPCLLYGYGSYEMSIDPTFSSLRLSLLDRGFIFAIAHVRGGGEMGRAWYEQGKLAAKPHTFTDFVACARTLVAEGWTSPDQLVARGASAGGLLMGAVANLAPELFRAVVAEVPFVDCLTTILDDSLPLTVLEWDEWGNPGQDPDIYRVMKSYSPFDNVRAVDEQGRPVRYPDILATAGLSDPRVGFWEPAKWVAKLRAANPENRVLLKTELGAGHGGPSGRYDAWKDEAFVYAFILDALGMTGDSPAGRTARAAAEPTA
jgi:oligopeptidase B